jgi:Glyoxalase-like domain
MTTTLPTTNGLPVPTAVPTVAVGGPWSGAPAARATPHHGTTSTFRGLAYDTYDARAIAEFWAAALRVPVAPGASARHAELLGGDVAGLPRLVFRQVTDGRQLSTPLHLQLTTDDLDGEARRLQGLGARRLGAISADGRRWVTLADPEGNEFDLLAA